ncbi:MAG TPA: hypothetical protein VGB18_03415, partial [Candidatus Thermoplasmatota archaeon]
RARARKPSPAAPGLQDDAAPESWRPILVAIDYVDSFSVNAFFLAAIFTRSSATFTGPFDPYRGSSGPMYRMICSIHSPRRDLTFAASYTYTRLPTSFRRM